MVGQAVEVLLGLVEAVELPLPVEEAVTLALADLVLVPRVETELVGLDVPDFEEVAVLVLVPDPVIVLEVVIDDVKVFVFLIVPDTKGERDADADAVGVLDGRTEAVPEPEPDDVFDGGEDLV
jgi:hypothetical protein